MTSPAQPQRKTGSHLGAAIAIVLAIIMSVANLSNIAGLWIPSYTAGLEADQDGNISAIEPGSSADKAGMRVGDHVDMSSLSFAQKFALFSAASRRDERVSLIDRTQRRAVTLVSQPTYTNIYLVIKRFAGIIFTLLGLALVLMRPSRMTWGFYIYALTAADSNVANLAFLPTGVFCAAAFLYWALLAARPVGFLIFGVRFPNDEAAGWKRWPDQFAPVLAVTMIAAKLADPIGSLFNFPRGLDFLNNSSGVIELILYAIGVLALVDTYARASGDTRQRISWVLGGLAVSVAADIFANVTSFLPNMSGTQWLAHGYVRVIDIVVPITVAYAILRYRVLDITFVVSKTLVYALLTSILIIMFSLIDWVFVRRLEDARLGLFVEIATAIGLGFGLNSLHKRSDALIETLFFRRRHLAEMQLERVIATLPHTTSKTTLEELIVEDPAHGLQLASAALFERDSDGGYVRRRALGWATGCVEVLDINDRVVLQLQAEHGVVRIHEIRWPRTDVPTGAAYPSIAVPVLLRRQVVAILLYGAHASGADLDPDEVKILGSLATAASLAYDHLEAQDMRRQLEAAQRRIETLSAVLQHTAIRPGSAPATS